MHIKKVLLAIIITAMMATTATAQNKLQIKDTIADEKGSLRKFAFDSSIPAKTSADAVAILKSVLVTDENTGFRLVKTKTKSSNQKSILYQQLYKNVPVYDAYYYLHFKSDVFNYANGEYTAIKNVDNSIKLDKTGAIDIAVRNISINRTNPPSSTGATLILWRQNWQKEYKYVYKVQVVYPDALQSKECMVDAATGEVLISVPLVCNVNVPCAGATIYSGTRNFTGDTFGGGVRLREIRNGVSISTLNNQNNVNINAVDFANPTTTWTSAGANAGALDVHFAAEQFLDYFLGTFNRNSIDNNGHAITSYTNRWQQVTPTTSQPMDGAFFDHSDITFSFGNGLWDYNSVTALDVVAHELAHGIAWFEVGFNNTGEARSLNEGFSDIWGATVENWSALGGAKQTWTIGEEIMANGVTCLRSLRSPTTEGLRGFPFLTEGHYPDTRLGPNWDADNADEHVNATVLGHWYFLLSQGGAGINGIGNNFNVAGLGIQTAAQIAYNTELNLTPGADFMSVRVASIAYATQQWGANSCEVKSVTDAWFAVGVGAAYSGTMGLSISGSDAFCTSSGTYSIPNLPAGVTVTWSTSPTSVVTINTPNTTTTTLTKNYDGIFNLKASFTNVCGGSPIEISKNRMVAGFPAYGGPTGADTAWPNSNYTYYTFLPLGYPTPDSYYWQVPSGWSILSGQGTAALYLRTGDTGGPVEVEVTACGVARSTYKYVEIGMGSIWPDFTDPGGELSSISIYPNPATNTVNISMTNPENIVGLHGKERKQVNVNSNVIKQLQIINSTGLILKQYNYGSGNKSITLDISTLKSALYMVRIFDGQNWHSSKIIVQR